MEIIIDFSDNGLTDKDFNGRKNLENLLLNQLGNIRNNELYIDRPTHSCAIEFFEIIIKTKNLLVVKHCGGVS